MDRPPHEGEFSVNEDRERPRLVGILAGTSLFRKAKEGRLM